MAHKCRFATFGGLHREAGGLLLECGGLIAGAFNDSTFEEETLQLEPRDVLVAFSDGVTDSENREGEFFGEGGLLSSVTAHRNLSPAALLERLLDTVHHFSAGATQTDDLTLLVLRYSGAS